MIDGMPQPLQSTPASCAATIARVALAERGYTLVEGLRDQQSAMDLLGQVGHLLPQYDGGLTHEVTFRRTHHARSYSQSSNAIGPHTEAPAWQPTPAHLALYCHRQAACGGGHTDLFDSSTLRAALPRAHADLLTGAEMSFPWPASSGCRGVTRCVMLDEAPGRDPVLRFNYNLLTANAYDPRVGVTVADHLLPLGAAGRALAEYVRDLFEARRMNVLIPEHGLLIWNNRRMLHGRARYRDQRRHLTRFFLAEPVAADRRAGRPSAA